MNLTRTSWIFAILSLAFLLGTLTSQPAQTAYAQTATAEADDVKSGESEDASSEPATRMSPKLLWKLGRVGEATASPDGTHVAYTVRRYKLDKNKGTSSLVLLKLDDDSESTLLEAWPSIGSLQWRTVDGKSIVFFEGTEPSPEEDEDSSEESDDADEGEDKDAADPSNQCWTIDPESKSLNQVTDIEDGIANLKVSPAGDQLAFTLDIKLDDTVNDIFEDLPDADARIIDGLMYRHWNAWHDFKYSHLHTAKIENGKAGDAVDLMEDVKADCPVPPFGGSEQFNWSPDGKEIAYTLKDDPKWAESTDSNVYIVPADGSAPAKNLTENMPGYDMEPSYSPDGKYLGFQSMERASFESDRNRIMLFDRASGEMGEITAGLDQNANGIHWSPDSSDVYFNSQYRGTDQIFKINVAEAMKSKSGLSGLKQISKGRFNWSVIDVMPDGKTALATKMDMLRPKEFATITLEDSSSKDITNVNGEIYESLELPTIEERFVEATDGEKIQCWVIYPPGFDKTKKYPLVTYCQGGPQGQIGQWFSYRWNFHLMASHGDYIIVAPNRRGLPGFGRAWNDQISGDWGGQAMKDILSATDSLRAEPYIDKDRCGAIGASFGGYTVYWLMGNHEDRFATMVAHCGVYNLESMYGSTEELFFVNWDLGGPYWKSDEVKKEYDQFSPHRFAKSWDTPLLVIHGEKDFRVPVTQGMEAFTVAQVNEVPSRFLYFPNEGHWVMSPQNGVVWHRVFFDWLGRSLKEK